MSMEQVMLLVGAGCFVLVMAIFALAWCRSHHGRTGTKLTRGTMMNALGYGLLPAAAVWKAFENHTFMGQGRALIPPLTEIPFLTENGRFLPCHIEMALLILGFLAVSLWLIGRSQEMASDGGLLAVVLTVWAAIRQLTEEFRAETATVWQGQRMIQIIACAVTLGCMIFWTTQWARKRTNRHAWVYWLAVVPAIGILLVTAGGVLTVRSEIGDLAVIAGCAAAAMAATLAMNGEK